MALYRDAHSSESHKQAPHSAMTDETNNDRFFQGYQDRLAFIKDMAQQVREELSDDEKSEAQPPQKPQIQES